jgi:hypothetical protein
MDLAVCGMDSVVNFGAAAIIGAWSNWSIRHDLHVHTFVGG